MKITALLLLVVIMQVSASSRAQNINLSEANAPIKKIFKEIRKQTGYNFVYTEGMLKSSKLVNVRVKFATISEALDQVFFDQPLTYAITSNTIVVQEKKASDNVKADQAVPITVSGTITDEKGAPLPGASVTVLETNISTATDVNGHYSINAADKQTLVFSFVGYKKAQVVINNNPVINVQLQPAANVLNELVIVGYGEQKKINLTGAVSSVGAAELVDRPATSVTNALEGTMAGVTIVSNNGQPGRDAGVINVRGIGTLNNTAPMVVIDGVISTPTDMNAINPDDIESISVLKDAASSSIYGSRAANGVIVVTTKKGKKGSVQVTYSNYFGKQKATALPNYLPSWQEAELYNQAKINEGGKALYTAQQIQTFKDGSDPVNYPNTDWLKLFYNGSGFQQNHYLGVNGGNDKTQYAFSLGYFDQDGITQKTNTQRYTTRLNLTSKVNDKLSFNADLSYTFQPFTEPQSSSPIAQPYWEVISSINAISNIIPVKYPNGNYTYVSNGNPIAWLNSPSFNNQNSYNLQGIAGADWEIVNGLHLRPSLSYKLAQNVNNTFVSSIQYYNADGTTSGVANISNATDSYISYTTVTPQLLLDYSLKLGDHNFKALAGYSQEYTSYYMLSGYRQGFLNNDLSDLNVAPTNGQTSNSDSNELALQSVFGRLNYDYKGKYLIEGDLRDDGSSRFAPSKRWGLFPSASAGWRVSEEDFFAPAKDIVSNLKLRGSWGQLGNQSLTTLNNTNPNYPYIPTVNAGQNYPFGGVVVGGVAPVNGANNSITWETTTETDLGLDADLLNNKFSLTADYFIKNTTGILYNLPVGGSYGLNAPVQNTASVQNKGWEFALTYHEKAGDFRFNISGNASFIKNNVTNLGPSAQPVINGATITKVGLPIGAYWGYQTQGIFQTQAQVSGHAVQNLGGPTGPGDLIYKNQNSDSKIDGNDKVYLGSNFPKVTFGLNVNVIWKQFDLTGFFQGAAGVKNMVNLTGQIGNTVGKALPIQLNAWSPSNTSAEYPRLAINYRQNFAPTNPSSFWIKDASYVRLKDLQLGYTLPQKWADALHIKKLRIYYSGQNIATFKSIYSWIDPEAPNQVGGSAYPLVKVNTLGLNVTF